MDVKVTHDSHTLEHARELLRIVLNGFSGDVGIRLWNDELLLGTERSPVILEIYKPEPLREMLFGKNLNKLAEHYIAGDLGYQGNLEKIFDLVDFLQFRRFSAAERFQLLRAFMQMHFNPVSVFKADTGAIKRDGNSRRSISHHYDVANEFYERILDPEMIYSCAYFLDEAQTLAQAQQNKLNHICRKLMLKPGDRLLDIGCGWAGLVIWAATHYRVTAHGITLSQKQYEYGLERVRKLGLQDQVSLELRDYRQLQGAACYDKIVSVGMFEHIGVKNFPIYFSTVEKLLKPGGLFLNHGITNDTGWRGRATSRFINEYIFPDGELARVSDVSNAMEHQGFEILDVEAMRPHYAMTLRHWLKNLQENQESIVEIAGMRTYRLWRLYMAGAAYYFDHGNLGLYQILAGKNRHPWPLPLSRAHLYS